MLPRHVVILKANQGEFKALRNLDSKTVRRILPLFEVGHITDAIRQRKYFQNSQTPTMTYLNRVLDAVGQAWTSHSAMVDGFRWAANAHAENGDHVIAYMVAGLRARGVSVIPVVGYDRWENIEYRSGIKAIPAPEDGHYCLRLDSAAVEDAAEPEHFEQTITDIMDELDLDPSACSVLLDFGDISMDSMSVDVLVGKGNQILHLLEKFGFRYYTIAGCSFPRSIDLAVSSRDSTGMVLRKEMVAWQALRMTNERIVSGDYGVRGPTTTEKPSKFTNGKIRHTTKLHTFVARGHAIIEDHSNIQMQGLASTVIESPHFLGGNFSWGDSQILTCSSQGAFGAPGDWIAIDTNHHLTFVVHEVEEFERELVTQAIGEP